MDDHFTRGVFTSLKSSRVAGELKDHATESQVRMRADALTLPVFVQAGARVGFVEEFDGMAHLQVHTC